MTLNRSVGLSGQTSRRPGTVEQKPKNKPIFTPTRILVGLAVALLAGVVYVALNNRSRSPDDFYALPRNADDWAAWATWLAFFATVGAVLYAAEQFRVDAAEKRVVRLNRDKEARQAAASLRLTTSRHYREDPQYPGERPDEGLVSGVVLEVINDGDTTFENVQLKVPDLVADLTYSGSAPIPVLIDPESPSFGPAPSWKKMDPKPLAVPNQQGPHQNQVWLCGDLPPQTMFRLTVTFRRTVTDRRWDKAYGSGEVKGRIAVFFTDHENRNWVRSTEGTQRLQRLWPESFIVEQHRSLLTARAFSWLR